MVESYPSSLSKYRKRNSETHTHTEREREREREVSPCNEAVPDCQLLTSADPTVRHIAETGLQAELVSKRKNFCPTVIVQQTLQEDPGHTRKSLSAAAKQACEE